jgi:hypothetical protein
MGRRRYTANRAALAGGSTGAEFDRKQFSWSENRLPNRAIAALCSNVARCLKVGQRIQDASPCTMKNPGNRTTYAPFLDDLLDDLSRRIWHGDEGCGVRKSGIGKGLRSAQRPPLLVDGRLGRLGQTVFHFSFDRPLELHDGHLEGQEKGAGARRQESGVRRHGVRRKSAGGQ